jgi:hypothetical protein
MHANTTLEAFLAGMLDWLFKVYLGYCKLKFPSLSSHAYTCLKIIEKQDDDASNFLSPDAGFEH